MSKASIKTVLPLALVTCTSMLAMDLYLPAVPNLQQSLGIRISLAQATVAVFLAGLAASQLLWGEALNRVGPRRCVQIGVFALIVGSVGCALAPSIEMVLAMRLLQGIAAGAATVIAPSVVRATLSNEDAVRGIATISMIEAIVPAAGPLLGAVLLNFMDWRGTFWVLAAATLLVWPFAVAVTPRQLPGLDRSVPAGYRVILRNGRFARLALSHALCIGALLTFVASAPQLVRNALQLDASAFAVLQLVGVGSFIVMASQSARIATRLGAARAVHLGAGLQVLLCAALLAGALVGRMPFWSVLLFWSGFCGALAVRGPPAFSDALAVPAAQIGRASAMLVLALLVIGALGTQLVAPFMDGASAAPLAAGMLLMLLVSVALVVPYPAARADRLHDC
jgi:MFS transporter, DHA1 family, multidrug resistance protein